LEIDNESPGQVGLDLANGTSVCENNDMPLENLLNQCQRNIYKIKIQT
jgi:hypothetical protein